MCSAQPTPRQAGQPHGAQAQLPSMPFMPPQHPFHASSASFSTSGMQPSKHISDTWSGSDRHGILQQFLKVQPHGVVQCSAEGSLDGQVQCAGRAAWVAAQEHLITPGMSHNACLGPSSSSPRFHSNRSLAAAALVVTPKGLWQQPPKTTQHAHNSSCSGCSHGAPSHHKAMSPSLHYASQGPI